MENELLNTPYIDTIHAIYAYFETRTGLEPPLLHNPDSRKRRTRTLYYLRKSELDFRKSGLEIAWETVESTI